MGTATTVPDISSLEHLVGTDLGSSEWIEITQDLITAFAEVTGDRQWIHVDVDRARRESPFGTTVAQGYFTLALMPVLLGQILEVRGARYMLNPGLEKVRLRAPVRSGSRIRMHANLLRYQPLRLSGAMVTMHFFFEVEGENRPAASGNALVVYHPWLEPQPESVTASDS